MSLPTAILLPSARRVPLPPGDPSLSRLPDEEKRIARDLLRDADVFHVAATKTRVDVGAWLYRRRAWLIAREADLLIIAAGPMPMREVVAYDELRKSLYNHVTGELVLDPAPNVAIKRYRLPVDQAHQLLAQIYQKELDYA